MQAKRKYLLLITCIAFTCFIISSLFLNGYLENKQKLGTEVFSQADSLYLWQQSEIAPFKYRFLFSSIVKSTYKVITAKPDSQVFYNVYFAWSGITYIASVLAFYYLLLAVNFSPKISFWGSIAFLLNPAVIFAYTLPVHTKEDFLAYTILSLAIMCIIKKKHGWILLLTILGVLCRETLLLIPFLYLFFIREKLYFRIFTAFIGFATLVIIRVYLGLEKYDALGLGYYYNLNNLVESIGFIFLVFNFMWIPFLYSIFFPNDTVDQAGISMLNKSAFWVLVLVFTTTLFGGRFNEIRLMYILFPWVLILTFHFLIKQKESIIGFIKTRRYQTFAVISAVIFIFLTIFAVSKSTELFPPGPYFVPYDQWIFITFFYLLITILFLPPFIKAVKLNITAKS